MSKPKKEFKNSSAKLIIKAIRKQKIFKILIPLAIVIIIISSYFNLKSKELFSQTNDLYIQEKFKDGFKSLLGSMMIVFYHYVLSQIAAYLIGYSSLLIFKAFLTESLLHSIHQEYTKFHSKGSAVIQDNITRSSKAARDMFPIIFFESTWSTADIFFSIYKIYSLLSLKYFGLVILTLSIGGGLAFFVAVFSYGKDRKILSLLSFSLIPLSDTLNNFDIFKSYNRETFEVKQYHNALGPFEFASREYYFLLNIFKLIQKTSMLLPNILIYYYTAEGKFVWRDGMAGASTIILYNNLFSSLKKDITVLRDHIFRYTKYASQLDTETPLFDEIKEVPSKITKTSFDREIRLDCVDLYAGNNPVQKNQSFRILKNEKVAITGTNGSGKSVFMKTLLKFFRNEGNLYVDDELLQNISEKSIRDLIAYTPQDPHIFNNTVMYNLQYSQKIPDQEKVIEICHEFGLHEFFKSLRDGYLTIAGEKGKYLSGGQRQRISFMRSIIKQAPILIMDEPTANIDKRSEFDLIDKVLQICDDRTFILIVHNLELLPKFDKIIHFEKGGITCFDSYESFKKRSN